MLTENEIDVVIRLDLRNQEIAEDLNINIRSIQQYIYSIMKKFNVETRTAAYAKAIQSGYIVIPPLKVEEMTEDIKDVDLTNRWVLLKEKDMLPSFQAKIYRVVRCIDGFGTEPGSRGKVFFDTPLPRVNSGHVRRINIERLATQDEIEYVNKVAKEWQAKIEEMESERKS